VYDGGPLHGARAELFAAARRAVADGQHQLAAALASTAAARAAAAVLTAARPAGPARARLGSTVSGMPSKRPRWLLLIGSVRVPATPSRHRVRVWRRLRQAGAVALRKSVYVLPNTPRHYETFQKIAQDILRIGGEAVLFTVDHAENLADEALDRLFRGVQGARGTRFAG
jgi:hypothetical protein